MFVASRNWLPVVVVAALSLASSSPGQTILREVFTNITGGSVANLTGAPNYPYSPDLRVETNLLEAPVSFGNNYGTRMRGYVLPPASGSYTFWIASDDNSELYLSSSEEPELKTLIARVPGYTSSRQWTKFPEQRSAPIPLQSGRRYYLEALHKEGTGGDNLAVGWTWPDGTDERPIPGIRLQPWLVSTSPPSLLIDLADVAAFERESPTFSLRATGAEPLYYFWFRDGAAEAELSSGLQLEAVEMADSGSQFLCIVSNALGAVTSRVATLTVLPETNAPALLTVQPQPGLTVRSCGQVQIIFTEPVVGVDSSDLLVNGQPATNVVGFSVGPYVFQFPPQSAGPVTFSWSPAHGIVDFSTSPNPLVAGSWTNLVDPAFDPGRLVITEFMAANESGLTDEDGEPQDWVEIQNQGTNRVNLAGWSLSDDEDQPGLWTFPERLLEPAQFLIVFASGKDRAGSGTNELHTNFRLNPAGEFLSLFTPEGPPVLASGFAPEFPEQRNDISHGITGAGLPAWFSVPTPGASNSTLTSTSIVADVHFSVHRGVFNVPFNLTLHTPTPGAVIRYTADGSVPNPTNGFEYTGGIPITVTATIRAAAFKTNWLPSMVGTHSYFYSLSSTQLALPVLSIVTDSNHLWGRSGIMGISGGMYSNGVWYPVTTNDYHNPSQRGDAWERPTSAELVTTNGGSEFQIDCGIRVHGSPHIRPRYTPNSKFSFRLYFRGDYGPTWLQYPWFPLAGVDEFDVVTIRAGKNDLTNPFLKDELVRRLGVDMGMVQVSGAYASLFINGVYKGYFNPCERVENGFLYQHHGGSKEWDVIANSGSGTVQDGDAVEWTNLRNFATGHNQAIEANFRRTCQMLDVTNYADYILVNAWCCVRDWPDNNWRAARCRNPGGPFRFYIWDAEGAFGGFNAPVSYDIFAAPTNIQNSVLTKGTSPIPRFYQALVQSPEFRLMFADRVHRHMFNGGALTDEHVAFRFNEMAAELTNAIANFKRDILTNWIPNRRRYLIEHLVNQGLFASSNAPMLSQHGGRVPPGFALLLTNRTGTIYFTTNGTDPRAPFSGAVSSNAMAYTPGTPLILSRSTPLRARSLSGAEWSALVAADFIMGTLLPPLRITEIHYHPVGGDAYEFLELRNVGDTPIDISGYRFAGIEYQVPNPTVLGPGQIYLLANNANPASFAARYPNAVVNGWFGGNLSNGGERVAVLDTANRIVTAVDYDDDGGWPDSPDGGGHSLQLLDPFGDSCAAANWVASSAGGGTPGVADLPSPPNRSAIRLNELQALNLTTLTNDGATPDWIEIYNASGTPMDLGGWSLTDDSNPTKFVFPTNTVIEPDDYLVVWCDTNSAAPGLHTGFALDGNGESVRLFDPATNCADALTFGRQFDDYSVGDLGDGWDLCSPTPGANNVAAVLAPVTDVVLNEWLANPLPGESDWIELYNTNTNLPVALSGLHLANGSSADRLPALTFLGPDSHLLLWCDEQPGPRHLNFKLPASGSVVTLHDPLGRLFHIITNSPQAEAVSSGRIPDGGATLTRFPAQATPGAPNAEFDRAPVRINEVMTRNLTAVTNPLGGVSDWIELYNPHATNFDLTGCIVNLGSQRDRWFFPAGAIVDGGGWRVVWCDPSRPPSTNDEPALNLGRALDDCHSVVQILGPRGQIFDAVEYGFQVADQSLGRYQSSWFLLSNPTPGEANGAPASLGTPAGLRFNEWMPLPAIGEDWLEIFNRGSFPVRLDSIRLTDDPSVAGVNKWAMGANSYIGPLGWVVLIADGEPGRGGDHLSFRLDAEGETLCLYYSTPLLLMDSIGFGPQASGVSAGRYPDGVGAMTSFVTYPTPGRANIADSDADLIPDAYEQANGLNPNLNDSMEDLDLDGASNYHEFLAGTGANDPSSLLRLEVLAADPTTVTLRLRLGASRGYELQATAEPTGPGWGTLTNLLPVTAPYTLDVEDVLPATNQARFYRLQVVTP